jgi:ABC-type histidine transport system ATPase subunit
MNLEGYVVLGKSSSSPKMEDLIINVYSAYSGKYTFLRCIWCLDFQ